ncbi:MAG: hypothetical protein ABSG78_01905 [Verrucomicrobiota bacterium]
MSGKAALSRPHSKTRRHLLRAPQREASWSAERQFRFAPAAAMVAPLTLLALNFAGDALPDAWDPRTED